MAKFNLASDLDEAHLGILLKGVVRRHVLKDTAISGAALQAAAFEASAAPPARQGATIAAFQTVLCAAAKEDWSDERMAGFLAESAECPDDAAGVLKSFWSAWRGRCRTALLQRSAWGRTARRVGWRVEIEAGASRSLRPAAGGGDAEAADADAAGEASAVMEITTAARAAPGQRAGEGAAGRRAVLFRADRAALVELEAALAAAEEAAARVGGASG